MHLLENKTLPSFTARGYEKLLRVIALSHGDDLHNILVTLSHCDDPLNLIVAFSHGNSLQEFPVAMTNKT